MAYANKNFLALENQYLFAEIANRREKYAAEHPGCNLISLGIGDVTSPIVPAVTEALHKAVDEMAAKETFQGYGPYEGYAFLRDEISKEYAENGVEIASDEIFISDGAKSDMGNILDLFCDCNKIAITDPVYPAYVDANVIKTGGAKIGYLPCTEEHGFTPEIPKEPYDLVYICSPNNPTGTALTRSQLEAWVDYARKNKTIILFDAAYEAYISDEDVPHSIFCIEGAKDVAIEFRSYSKTAGFTGMRLGYAVIPKQLKAYADGREMCLNELWLKRQSIRYNGAPYIIQKGAQALYTEEGKKQTKATISGYMKNAEMIRNTLSGLGFTVFGGINAPYIWLKTPNGMKSWDFFDKLLNEAEVIGTPGVGFGKEGEGFFRLTAFGTYEATKEALNRISKLKF